jgi:hypothetical protein
MYHTGMNDEEKEEFIIASSKNHRKFLFSNKAVELLLSKFDANKSTALSRVRGEDISPLILGYLPYSSVAKSAHIE